MSTNIKKLLYVVLFALFPFIAFAQPATFRDFANLLVKLFQNFVALIFASLSVGLLYGVVLFMMNSDNEKKREENGGEQREGMDEDVKARRRDQVEVKRTRLFHFGRRGGGWRSHALIIKSRRHISPRPL